MDLKEGDKIKIFPDTDVLQYLDYIKRSGFRATREGNYIVIGKPYEYYRSTDYGNQIKKARRAKGWTRAELAEKCGVKEATVFGWEIGRKRPQEWQKVQRILWG